MSERKSDEIKFRVEPSVKAQWQEAADREQIALSEWIRRAAEEKLWAQINAQLQGGPTDVAPVLLDVDKSEFQTLLSRATEPPVPVPLVVKRDWKKFGA